MPAHDANEPLEPVVDERAPGEDAQRSAEAPDVGQDASGAPDATADAPAELDAVVRRRVNLTTFLVLGAIVGAILAVILTFAFPEHPEFSRAQVLGFFLVFVTALTAVVFAAIALIVDAIVSRRRGTVTMRRVRD